MRYDNIIMFACVVSQWKCDNHNDPNDLFPFAQRAYIPPQGKRANSRLFLRASVRLAPPTRQRVRCVNKQQVRSAKPPCQSAGFVLLYIAVITGNNRRRCINKTIFSFPNGYNRQISSILFSVISPKDSFACWNNANGSY